MHQLHPSLDATNRTLSVDISIEPTSDSSSTVLAIDPFATILAWTIIEAVALGFLTTAAFRSLQTYHHDYNKPNLHIPYTFFDNFQEDILDSDESKDSSISVESFVLEDSIQLSKQKSVSKEAHHIFKPCPILCSKRNMTKAISKS
ncbi:hypothetical protein AVEN_270147-1 [Araneus ventricosus]|uniref:Uncharacterized protein n=1 Tax=Araneus ventricosus TaxID=182803 RepID=A0A4Y2PBX1_ARAVE|nr:hypothetical protein AVEN_267003-1 [Araneus ventricosus]GBN49507.1 hypothetical protein AVEN_270147-1 [Araneus ventricosus]